MIEREAGAVAGVAEGETTPNSALVPYLTEERRALTHAIENKAEAAYRRSDLVEKRRRLMADWAKFCASPTVARRGTVVPLRAAR